MSFHFINIIKFIFTHEIHSKRGLRKIPTLREIKDTIKCNMKTIEIYLGRIDNQKVKFGKWAAFLDDL